MIDNAERQPALSLLVQKILQLVAADRSELLVSQTGYKMIHRPVHVVLCRGAFPPPLIKRKVDLLHELTKTPDCFFLALSIQLGDDSINQHSRVRLRQLRDQANRFASALAVNPPHR